jgi:hypothetical protein
LIWKKGFMLQLFVTLLVGLIMFCQF